MTDPIEETDVAVIGAGFGGLGAAIGLAEANVRVVVCELLDYAGGCAGTFERKGARFDAGATLSSGFGEGQLFAGLVAKYGLKLTPVRLDPVVELRTPDFSLPVSADREAFIARMVAIGGDRGDAVRRFFALQAEVAATLWSVLDDPAQLPPFGPGGFRAHLGRVARYLPIARWMGRPLADVLAHFGLQDVAPLRIFCDAVCQITVQCATAEAEAPFALGTLDYFFRGVAHLEGGIGELAHALTLALDSLGASVCFHRPVRRLRRDGDGWLLDTRRGPLRARAVIANVLPQAVMKLCGADAPMTPRLERLSREVETGWSAAMLYLLARSPEGAPRGAHHLELIGDPNAKLIEGNHLFVSISGADEPRRAPDGLRTLTVSTHLPAPTLQAMSEEQTAVYVANVQRTMHGVLAARAPEWSAAITWTMSASPRTFERYTRRPMGLVGGIPRRAGLHNYRDVFPRAVAPGLWLVGDTIFPGQSTVAAALGGLSTARAVKASLSGR